MKKISEETYYVHFNFGSYGSTAYVGVNIYEGKTLEENLKIRSQDIDSYLDFKTKKWVEI